MRRPESIHRESGFTLIELSVIMMILGILFCAFAPGYSLYLKDKRFKTTDTRTDDIAAKMFEFRQMNGRYPCPASLTAARGSSAYGKESNCNTVGFTAGSGVYIQTSSRTAITAPTPYSGAPKIIIGAVPFRALNISEDSAYDAYGARIVMAVTQSLTDDKVFRESQGGISIVNDQGKDFFAANFDASIPSSDPKASGHFVVLSTGKTQLGAYSMQGTLINPCTGTTADIANCDYLPGATHQNQAVFSARSYSEGAGNNFFDDIVKFDPGGAKTPWKFVPTQQEDVVNMAAEKVVLGLDTTSNPKGELSIMESTTASTVYDGSMNVRQSLMTPMVCDPAASTAGVNNCFKTSDLLNPCGSGQYLTGFLNGQPQCANIYIGCSVGQYMHGTDGDGKPICRDIVVPRCGTAASSNSYPRPTTNMCTQTGPNTYFTVAQIGSTRTSTENRGESQIWEWDCGRGSPGGGPDLTRTQSCVTRQIVDGVCGRLQGPYEAGQDWTGNYLTVANPAYPNPPPVPPATTSIPPTIQIREMVPYYAWTGTCDVGNGDQTWTRTLPSRPSWTCSGWNGGRSASCPVNPPPINGRCGSSPNSCLAGAFQDTGDTSSEYRWSCTGQYGGTTASCSYERPLTGTCDNTTVNGCLQGTASGMSSDASYAYWYCSGSGGGGSSGQCQKAVACSAGPIDTPVNGACNNLIVNGCARGSAINITSDPTSDYWNCSGAFGGSNSAQCQKAKAVAGGCLACDRDSDIRPNTYAVSDCQNPYYMTREQVLAIGQCRSGTGFHGRCGIVDSSYCNSTRVNGQCNNSTRNACSSGTSANASENATQYTWSCNGSNGGTNATNCAMAKPPSYTYNWVQDGFGACSASCGGGTQTQNVYCRRNDGQTVADSFCSGGKPATSQSCNPQACAPPPSCFFWVSGVPGGNVNNVETGNQDSDLITDLIGRTGQFGGYQGTNYLGQPAGSGTVAMGDYANVLDAPSYLLAANGTFDGMAIGANTRVVIYSGLNFTGSVVFDQTGPILINNHGVKQTEDWSSSGLPVSQFTPSTRRTAQEILGGPSNNLWMLSGQSYAQQSGASGTRAGYGPKSMRVICGP